MKPTRKKLLAAAVGVAAINYYGCQTNETSGNLMTPTPQDAGADQFISSGNLMPPPIDAGPDADASSADAAPDAATLDAGSSDAKSD